MTLPTTIPLLGWTWNDLLFLILGAVLIGTALSATDDPEALVRQISGVQRIGR